MKSSVKVLSRFLVLCSVLSALTAWGWEIPESELKMKAPPRAGSAAEAEDYRELLAYQSSRTSAECKEANLQTYPSMKVFFTPEMEILSTAQFTRVEAFGNKLIKAVSKASHPFKKKYSRLRPYDHDSSVLPCIRKPSGQTSYPSSHAAMGWILGEVLAEIYPKKAIRLKEQGMRIGELRVLGGVHHPTDIEAGRDLAQQVLELLREDDEFIGELEALK